jgi:quinol monooxygenase YgiN
MSSSPQVVVVATVQVKPGTEDEALAALAEGVAAAHGEEGCLAYALHRDRDDPTRFVIVERWASQEALDDHNRQPHLAELLGRVGPLAASAPSIIRTSPVPAGDLAKGTL